MLAAETSNYPFLLYEDLPETARESLENWQDRALFMAYPQNRWGIEKVGRVGYMKKHDQFGWRWEYLDESNTPGIQRMAELTYDMYAEIESNIESLYLAGRGERFPTRHLAEEFVRGLEKKGEGPTIRVDPATGEAWVFPWEQVRGTSRVQSILEERNRLGRELLGGESGRVGSGWVDAD